MRLRGRFTLWFVLAALIPVAAAAVGTREILSQNYRDQFEQDTAQARSQVERSLRRLEASVAARVETMSDRDDPFVGGLLQELVKQEGLTRETLQRLRQRGAPTAMKLARFDALLVVDADGTVVVAPHYRPSQDELDRSRNQLARTMGGRAFYTVEPLLEDGAIRRQLVVEAVRSASLEGKRVTVVGAVVLGADVLEGVQRPGTTDARIIDPDGAVIVGAKGAWGDVSARQFRVPLPGPGGDPVAFIEVGISGRNLEELLETVTYLSAGLGAAAFLVMVLVGYGVARRMTSHLDDLVVGAQATARGDLEYEVPVRTSDEIGEVAQALNTMISELKESKERLVMAERVAAWQEIARRLAHEIKNPLTPIQMAVETLRKTHAKKHPSFEEIFEESTATVLEEAARLKRIVSEFSEFARMPKPEKKPCDLNELVSSTLALYQGVVSVERDLHELPSVEIDRDSMSQVILNLLENARDAISAGEDAEGGKIAVQTRVTRDGKGVALIIEDNGPGLPPEGIEKLFTPYFTTKHTTGGTGLGLAIVHRIVSDHGGRISASDAPGGGARFVIELPTPKAGPEELAASLSGRWLR